MLLRIDDRLIHGQVVAAWVRHLRTSRIVIVDDFTASDDMTRAVLEMVTPPDIELRVLSLNEAQDRIAGGGMLPEDMVLVKSPAAAASLINAGLSVDRVNLGGLGAGPGRQLLYRNVSISDEELRALQALMQRGVGVYWQAIPTDKPLDIRNTSLYRKKFGGGA